MKQTCLPVSAKDMKNRRWDQLDVILITGDAYVDHPSYGSAVIGRVLEHAGYRVGIISQPDWRKTADFSCLGKPRLFFGITAGNLDSMVSNYTAGKRPRKRDDYSPGGEPFRRPDRAVIVYANRVREVFADVPMVLGGIEASLRRFAHYDWWDNGVRRSILLDTRADILVYGMGEQQILEIAGRLTAGTDLTGIPGTAVLRKDLQGLEGFVELPDYNAVCKDFDQFNKAITLIHRNQDPFRGKTLVQRYDSRYVVQFPPSKPMKSRELDTIYDLPYTRQPHPMYEKKGGIPGFETVKFSLISHRGCSGECSFCSLSLHQGRIVQSRSPESVFQEARLVSGQQDFRGTITDVGGPTANLYAAKCRMWEKRGACEDRHCLTPKRCENLKPGYREGASLYKRIRELPGVKHVFIESGFRHDLLIQDEAREYLAEICRYHVSGQMKVAPEHCSESVLRLMNKPSFEAYERFAYIYKEMNRAVKKNQYLVHYFISAHPGSTLEDTLHLATYLMEQKIHPEQIQDFMPLPLTISGAMYYTEKHPFTNEPLYVAKTFRERKMHRALIQYGDPKNRGLVREALHILHKEHLMARFYGAPSQSRKT